MNTFNKAKDGCCPCCGFKLMAWFPSNMCCSRCGFDDSLPIPELIAKMHKEYADVRR